MPWSPEDDAALIACALACDTIPLALAEMLRRTGRETTRAAADYRLVRIGQRPLAALIDEGRRVRAKGAPAPKPRAPDPEIEVTWDEDDEHTDPSFAAPAAGPGLRDIDRVDAAEEAGEGREGGATAREVPHADPDRCVERRGVEVPPSRPKRILIVPDVHVPFHNPASWALLLRAGHHIQPDIVVSLGDLLDFYAVSFHAKSPKRRSDLAWEIGEGRKAIQDLTSLGASQNFITYGNHEHRLARYVAEKCPAMFDMFELDKLLGLPDLGWHVTPYQRALTLGHLRLTHDEGNAGIYAHYRASSTFRAPVVIGHTHRMAVQYQGTADGDTAHVSAMFGWLGSVDDIDYVHRAKANTWMQGFGVGVMTERGDVHLQACPIVNGQVCVFGDIIGPGPVSSKLLAKS